MNLDLRLAVPAVVGWLTCALAIGVPEAAGWLAAGAWGVSGLAGCAAIAAGVLRPRSGRPGPGPGPAVGGLRLGWAALGLSLVGGSLALTAIAADVPRRTSVELTEAAASGATVGLAIRTDSTPRRIASAFDGGDRWMWKGATAADVPVTVMASLPPARPGPPGELNGAGALGLGSVVGVDATIRPTDPGESTSYLVLARGHPRVLGEPPAWLAWTGPLRAGLSAAAADTPGGGGDLLPGLSIGDESAVNADLDEAMKASSLSHLTAVSGANCALVAGVVFVVSAALGLGRRTRILVALTALVAFVALVTPGASVIRAAAMAVVVLLAVARGRPAQGVPVLALAVLALLLHDPWLARDYGFALSVLATAGLLVLASPLSRLVARWMPRSIAAVLSIPLAAQLACQPVLILLSPTLPLYGVGANLLAGPAAPAATLLGLAACLLLPVAPAVGQALVWLGWLPSAWIAQIAGTVSGLPASRLPWLDGPVGVLLCAAMVLGVVIVAASHPTTPTTQATRPSGASGSGGGAGGGRGRGILTALAIGGLIAGAGAYGGALVGGGVGQVLARPHDWQIAACDVGQGDGLLVRDGDAVAMIDVGREPEPATRCLRELGIDRLALLVLTHYDADHAGGLDGVLGRADAVIVGQTGRDADDAILRKVQRSGAPVTQGFAGLTGTIGDLEWRILWPPRPAAGTEAASGNDGSIALLVEGRGLRSIFLADLGEDSGTELLATGAVEEVDVVKVAHHGSSDQSDTLYERLDAALALVSVGEGNGYGHPAPKTLSLLKRVGTAVARTDTQGLLLVSPGSETGRVRVWSERDADGGRPYAGEDRGGTWRHEPAARPARARGAPRRQPSRSWHGIRSGRRRWSWCRGRKDSWPIARSAPCAMRSRRRTRAWRSAISPPTTTPPASCSRSRAHRCSASPGSSASMAWRSATRPS